MPRDVSANWIAHSLGAGALLVSLLGCGGGTAPAPTPLTSGPPIFTDPQNLVTPSPGTTWDYAYTVTGVPQWSYPTSGLVEIRYDGPKPYRSSAYDEIEEIGSITGQDFYVYFVWNNGFDELATANTYEPPMPCNTPPRSETVLDSPVDFIHPHVTTSGIAQYYICSSPNGTASWSSAVNDSGTVTITVPAGTFLTSKITGVWKLGSVERDYTSYLYGSALIERDTIQYKNGSPYGSFTVKLQNGPTNVAIPGPTELGADYW